MPARKTKAAAPPRRDPMDDDTLTGVLATLAQAVAALEAGDLDAEAGDPGHRLMAAALVQDLRKRLSGVETSLTTVAGKALGRTTDTLPDGRQFTLQRASDRQAWDHEDWKRDARRAIVADVDDRYELVDVAGAALVDTHTGEPVSLASILFRAITEAQEVHGSTAPRSTSLRRLGLYASDYCTSSPSGWRLNVTPAPTNPTTTDKDA